MSNFKKVAQQNTAICPLAAGRTKLKTEDVVGKKLTIIGFDFAPKRDNDGSLIVDPDTGLVETYGVVVFKEKPEDYYCVGTVFSKVCRAWMDDYDTAEEASADLAKEGGVAVRFVSTKTKSGNNLVSVEII